MATDWTLRDVPEFLEVDIGESILARTECLGTFRELGPPDLAHIVKTGRSNAKDAGSYHYVSGVDASSSASIAAYLNSLSYFIEQPLTWLGSKSKPDHRISRGCYCVYNAFSRLDVRVEVKIPGGVEAYTMDARGDKQPLGSNAGRVWLETYLSAVLRSILYADDESYRLAGYRKLEPIKSQEDEQRFLAAAEQLFHQGWQLGSDPEVQIATLVNNHLTAGILKYFGEAFRFQPAVVLFEKLLVKEGEVACLLAQSYLGMSEEVKAVQVLHRALREYPQSYQLLHVQCDFLRSKGKADWALQLARSAVNCAPSEFVTWAKMAECYIDLQQYDDALLTLNTCPMFTYNEKDLHRMPTPAKTHLPIKQFLVESNILEPPNEQGLQPEDMPDESQSDPILLRLPAATLKGTFKQAYRILTKLVSYVGWDELLKARSTVFVMEEEYRQQQSQSQSQTPVTAGVNGADSLEDDEDDRASVLAMHQTDIDPPAERMSVPSSPIPTIKVSSESDGERDRLREEGILPPVDSDAAHPKTNGHREGAMSTLQEESDEIERPSAVTTKSEVAEKHAAQQVPDSAASYGEQDSPQPFNSKRLCERWLDNLFMVLYEDLRVLTVWRSEMTQFKAQHIPYKRTSTEWEILGDLALRLHKREEAKDAYQRASDIRFSAKAWTELLSMYVEERDVGRSLNAATRLSGYNQRWYHESAYPSEVGHQLFKLMQQEGVSKVSYSLVSMRLPDSILKMMQRYFEDAAWLLQPDH